MTHEHPDPPITIDYRPVLPPKCGHDIIHESYDCCRDDNPEPRQKTSFDGVEPRHNDEQQGTGDSQFSYRHLGTKINPVNSTLGDHDFYPGKECPTRRNFSTPRFTLLNGIIIVICGLSTCLSALFVLFALKGQRYGDYIGNSPVAKMSISTAVLWTSVLAKTVELTFVTGFVTFLGQVLSRRAFAKGVTLSELTMWRWVVQPGTLVTQSEIARYAGWSLLGALALLSTVLSTLYVTAATALVQPVPKMSHWNSKTMAGTVSTDFANFISVQKACKTPLSQIDMDYSGSTCTQLQDAGRSYYNLATYLGGWEGTIALNESSTTDQRMRPAWIGLPYANSTIVPQWIEVSDTTEASRRHKRIINNVTLALPHIGVVDAVQDDRNQMPESDDTNSVKPYFLSASVPSPFISVLCASGNSTELSPIVYDSWNNDTVNATTWTSAGLMDHATTTNETVLDTIFNWTKDDNKTMLDYPPVFAKFPIPFNTILNHTSFAWGRPSIYLLGQGGPMDDGRNLTGHYTVCKLEAGISEKCSTLYSVSVAGRKAEAHCEDPEDEMAYIRTLSNATTRRGLSNWRDIGNNWANSLSLGTGLFDGQASNSRTLMMLQLAYTTSSEGDIKVDLDPKLPSLAESLAVSASDTLVLSWKNAPFVQHWNYSRPFLEPATTQYFNIKIRSHEYASGGVDSASMGWIVILLMTCILNILMLIYFLLQPGLVTDFSQPPQLFALAINSPPARSFAGSCGGGPEGKQYKIGWLLKHDGAHLSLEPSSKKHSNDSQDHDEGDIAGTASIKPQDGGGFPSIILTALERAKPKLSFRNESTRRLSRASSVEPLQNSRTAGGASSLQSQYELGETDTQVRR